VHLELEVKGINLVLFFRPIGLVMASVNFNFGYFLRLFWWTDGQDGAQCCNIFSKGESVKYREKERERGSS
jgi:hypothetical protein